MLGSLSTNDANRATVLGARRGDLRSAGNNSGPQVFEPLAKLCGCQAIVFVIALDDAARFVGECR